MQRYSASLRDALALDHELQLLCGSARRRYEKRLQCDAEATQAQRAWQRRVMQLLGAVAPRSPPPSLWVKLRGRLETAGR